MNKEKEIKKGRHSRVFLSGISLLSVVNQIRKFFPYFTKAGQAGDPRLQHSGMTPLFNSSAFTLIELLVVVLIIGILAAIALPQYRLAVEKARAAEAITNLQAWANALERYRLANGTWPTSQASALEDIDITLPTLSRFTAGYYSDDGSYARPKYENENYILVKNLGAAGSVTGDMGAPAGTLICYYKDFPVNEFGEKICKSLCGTGSFPYTSMSEMNFSGCAVKY